MVERLDGMHSFIQLFAYYDGRSDELAAQTNQNWRSLLMMRDRFTDDDFNTFLQECTEAAAKVCTQIPEHLSEQYHNWYAWEYLNGRPVGYRFDLGYTLLVHNCNTQAVATMVRELIEAFEYTWECEVRTASRALNDFTEQECVGIVAALREWFRVHPRRLADVEIHGPRLLRGSYFVDAVLRPYPRR